MSISVPGGAQPAPDAEFGEAAVAALAEHARAERAAMGYATDPWVKPRAHPSGEHVWDVLIVGGGQSGLTLSNGLAREGVTNVLCIDRSPEGHEGPWDSWARMGTLRTPKTIDGTELGHPALSVRAWYVARFGQAAWDAIDRVPREHWMDYLRWYRATLGIAIRNGVEVTRIGRAEDGIVPVETMAGGKPERFLARRVVLATGYDGCGEWRIPPHIAEAVPADRVFHSNGPIDFTLMKGKRVGVLGHGASSFDNATRALEHGATQVDLCFRRPSLPIVNPHRWIEFVGFLKHFPDLDDAIRWRSNVYFKHKDQPPARWGFEAAHAWDNFTMHAGCPWDRLTMNADGAIDIDTPKGRMTFDYLICATGSAVDFARRPELSVFADEILLWQDVFTPAPEDAHPTLGKFPYLGPYYEFRTRPGGDAETLSRIHAYNFSAIVSMGPHSTSVSGHKYSVPRILRGLTRALMAEQQDTMLDELYAYDLPDLEPASVERAKLAGAAAE